VGLPVALHVPCVVHKIKNWPIFGKLTKKDEPTLYGVGQSNPPNDQALQWRVHAELDKKQVSLLLLPMSLVMHTGCAVA